MGQKWTGLDFAARGDIILISRTEGGKSAVPDVLVRDLDEATLVSLKDRASGNGRSLGMELKLILEQARPTVQHGYKPRPGGADDTPAL